MGNKPAKAATPTAPAAQQPPSEAATPTTEKPVAEGTSSSDNSPSVLAYDPAKERPTERETVTVEGEVEAATESEETPAVVVQPLPVSEGAPQQETAETQATKSLEQSDAPTTADEAETSKEAEPNAASPPKEQTTTEVAMPMSGEDVNAEAVPVAEESVLVEEGAQSERPQAAGGTEEEGIPPLDLKKVGQVPPPQQPEKEEHDPDLMAPPVFLTDAMSSLADTDAEAPTKKHTDETFSAVMLASPITHDEVSLKPPTPVSEPDPEPVVKDDVSIDEEVSAAGPENPSEPEVLGGATTASSEIRGLAEVPEDTISLTSSIARGDDELLKNIMGTSTAFPGATSNESVRGSVAVSEMTFDETLWDVSRRLENIEKETSALPLLVCVELAVLDETSIGVNFDVREEEGKEGEDAEDEGTRAVAAVMDSVFESVLQKAEGTAVEAKEVAAEAAEPRQKPPVVADALLAAEPEVSAPVAEAPKQEEQLHTAEATAPEAPTETAVAAEAAEPRQEAAVVADPPPAAKPESSAPVVDEPTEKEAPAAAETEPFEGLMHVMSDNQSSIQMKTPFLDAGSQDLSGTGVAPIEEAGQTGDVTLPIVDAQIAEEQPFEEAALTESRSEEPAPTAPETEVPLSTSVSEDRAKVERSPSGKKKKGSKSKTSSLKSSLSDGTASVDSSSSGSKTKHSTGKTSRGRGRGRTLS